MYACSLAAKWYFWLFKSLCCCVVPTKFLLFMGVVPMINLYHFYFMCVVVLWAYMCVVWLLSVDVNLCVVVCGCSTTTNFVVASYCMYWIAVCHAWGVSWLPLVTINVCNLLFCGCCQHCSAKFCWLLSRVTFDVNFVVFLIVCVVTLNLCPVCRMYFMPFWGCQFVALCRCSRVLW